MAVAYSASWAPDAERFRGGVMLQSDLKKTTPGAAQHGREANISTARFENFGIREIWKESLACSNIISGGSCSDHDPAASRPG